jgi:NarL family two-component system response regulator LiaR
MTDGNNIGIILVDDHRRVHQVISEIISFFDDIELLGHGSNGLEAIDLCDRYEPDLVLMDVVMPTMDGVEATKRILNKHPDIKILALSSFQDYDTAHAMLESGAVGYVLKDSSVNELENTIRATVEGKSILSPEIMQTLLTPPNRGEKQKTDVHLSAREQEVLQLFASGMTNGEIAAQLIISVSTVKFHITNILSKLSVDTRAEALVVAAKHNLV